MIYLPGPFPDKLAPSTASAVLGRNPAFGGIIVDTLRIKFKKRIALATTYLPGPFPDKYCQR